MDGPDLRTLSVELVKRAHEKWPELVLAGDATRVAESTDVLLVLLRVATGALKRAGLESETVEAAVKTAKSPTPASQVVDLGQGQVDVVGVHDNQRLLWAIDLVLADPTRRGRFPKWFVDEYWPSTLRRVALGERLTYRDVGILTGQLEAIGGRRE